MGELSPIAEEGFFGASVNMDEKGGYDYWASLAVPLGAQTPSGLSCLEVRGGKYAECVVENMSDIGNAYQYIYGEWNAQNENCVDFTTACLEYYQKDWQEGDPVTLYVPLQ
jgi:predicted transcriptional regulator YdeE